METEKKYSLGNIFFGGLCIAFGTLFLAHAGGFLQKNLFLSPLVIPPLVIVYIGLIIIPIRTRKAYAVGCFLVVTLILAMSILTLWDPCPRTGLMQQDDWSTWHHRIKRDHRMFRMDENDFFQVTNWHTY